MKAKPRRTKRVAEAPATYGGPGGGEIVLYRAPDGTVKLDVRLERETIWLTQAALFLTSEGLRQRSGFARMLRRGDIACGGSGLPGGILSRGET